MAAVKPKPKSITGRCRSRSSIRPAIGRPGNDGRHAVRLDRDLPGQGAHRGAVPPAIRRFQTAVNTGGSPVALSLLPLNGGVASEGGFPIVIDGKLVGAIGASGGIFTQDAVTAKAGLCGTRVPANRPLVQGNLGATQALKAGQAKG